LAKTDVAAAAVGYGRTHVKQRPLRLNSVENKQGTLNAAVLPDNQLERDEV